MGQMKRGENDVPPNPIGAQHIYLHTTLQLRITDQPA